MVKKLLRHHEFWNPRLFEVPFYIYLAWQCLKRGVFPTNLAKANSALDHGEIGVGSKFHTQNQFPQEKFLKTILLQFGDEQQPQTTRDNLAKARVFIQESGYPVIFKPDIGLVGKGILKIHSDLELEERIQDLRGAYLLQQYTPLEQEYGIFYVRIGQKSRVTGINRKHFPTVEGNGVDDLDTLAKAHERYTEHWDSFLQYHDRSQVPEKGERVKLSFIGSHTLGCKFTDDSVLLSPDLQNSVLAVLDAQPDFNYGRIDVKTADAAAMQRGDFVIIEVNGVSSLPTHMFDPQYSLWQAYQIFFEHGRYLVQSAKCNQYKSMHLLPFNQILKRVKINQSKLDDIHNQLKSGG